MYFWKSNICSNKLDVQETNVSIPQFHRIWNHFVGCWIANGWTTCSRPLRRSNWGVAFNKQHWKTKRLIICQMWTTYPQTQCSQGESQLYICEDNEAVIKMIIKGRSPTMRHVSRTQSCAWLVVRQNQFGSQNPNLICWHQTPTRRHANQRKLHTWWVEPSSSFV